VGLSIGDKVIANNDFSYKVKKGWIGLIIEEKEPFFSAPMWKISWNSGQFVEWYTKSVDGISKI
jgi:hypothetical protein